MSYVEQTTDGRERAQQEFYDGPISIVSIGLGEEGLGFIDGCPKDEIEGLVTIALDSDERRLAASRAKQKISTRRDDLDERLEEAIDGAQIVFITSQERASARGLVLRTVNAANVCGAFTVIFFLVTDGDLDAPSDEQHEIAREADAIVFVPEDRGAELGVAVRDIMRSMNDSAHGAIRLDEFAKFVTGANLSAIGIGEGSDPASAMRAAAESKLMKRTVKSATRMLLSMTTGPDVSRDQLVEAAESVSDVTGGDCEIMWGHSIEKGISGTRAVIIASRYDEGRDFRADKRALVISWLDRNGINYDSTEPDSLSMGFTLRSRLSKLELDLTFDDYGYISIATLPLSALAENRDEVMRFITMANRTLRKGNFEMDIDDGDLYFRTYTPYEDTLLLADAIIEDSIFLAPRAVDRIGNNLVDVLMGVKDARTAMEEFENDRG